MGDKQRLRAALRRAPRALFEDLTAPADPLPAMGAPGWPVWRPVFGMVLVFCAMALAVVQVNALAPVDGGAVPGYAVLLGIAQAAALIVAMSRPVSAWWASTVLMVVTARITEPGLSPDALFPGPSRGSCSSAGCCSCWHCGSVPAGRQGRW